MICTEEAGILRHLGIPTKVSGTEAGHHPGGTILPEEMVQDIHQQMIGDFQGVEMITGTPIVVIRMAGMVSMLLFR